MTQSPYDFKVRGEDFAVDLCGMLDILQPVVSLMIRAQAVNLPPWKIIAWHSRVTALLQKSENELKNVKNGSQPSKSILPKLAKHWQEINAGRLGNNEDEQEPGTFQVIEHYIPPN